MWADVKKITKIWVNIVKIPMITSKIGEYIGKLALYISNFFMYNKNACQKETKKKMGEDRKKILNLPVNPAQI
jgi:hypothetical protein